MKRIVGALVVGGVVFGGALAMAASLGGVQVGNLGASVSVVASCDTDGVSANLGYDASVGGDVRVGTVGVGGVASTCENHNLEAYLYNTGGTLIGEGGVWLDDSEIARNLHHVSISAPGIDQPDPRVEDVAKIVIVITG